MNDVGGASDWQVSVTMMGLMTGRVVIQIRVMLGAGW